MTDASRSGDSSLSARLAAARRRMTALDLPGPLAARLQRQFIAVCDAVKVAGADEAHGERRLAAFLAALDRAAGADSNRAADGHSNRAAGGRSNRAPAADPKRVAGTDPKRPDDPPDNS
ncbi:MAG TPA: hypothetical protein VGI58_10140 [Streptosporangiaceae bacterium]